MPEIKPPRILVAEDNELNQQLIDRLLRHRGCEVEVVNDGHEALEALRGGDYDLVILDCLMPRLNGFATARIIRHSDPHSINRSIPILATTALASERDQNRCFEAGMDDYLSKPIRADALFERVERLIGGRATTAIDRSEDALPGLDEVVNAKSGMLIRDALKWEKQLGELIDSRRWVDIRNLAHTIRGTADIIGQPRLSGLAEALELSAEAQDEARVAEFLPQVVRGLSQLRQDAEHDA